jgi:hypothetical protein
VTDEETDQQRMGNIRSEVCSVVNTSSRVASKVEWVTEQLLIEVTRLERLNDAALKEVAAAVARANAAERELVGVQAENRELVLGIESIAADRKAMEGHFNEAFSSACDLEDKLMNANRVAWSCVLITAVCLIGMIYGAYN